jgi:acetylglutamate kinase
MVSNNLRPIVIKFGGEVVESPQQISNLISSIKELHQQNEHIVLVHGGGPIASSLSKKLGISPNMIGGRRVTCSDTLEVMKMTLSGIVNSNILSLLKKHNLPGVCASSISFVDASKRPPKVVSGSDGKTVDFGHVGDVNSVDPNLLNHLLSGNFIPVVTPLSCDSDGNILNINADTIAVQIASHLNAKKLVLVTAIGGVFKDITDPDSKFKKLNIAEAKNLIQDGTIQGGMIPKLEEGFKLIDKGMNSFHIVNTETPSTLLDEIIHPGSQGTAVINTSSC